MLYWCSGVRKNHVEKSGILFTKTFRTSFILLVSVVLFLVGTTNKKTKFSSYNSFYVEVNEADFITALSSRNNWPEGTLIAPYLGSLRRESMAECVPSVDGVATNTDG